MAADTAPLPECAALRGLLTAWREAIRNSFSDLHRARSREIARVTPGVVEGNNHRAKVIPRQADGYPTFATDRLRLLLAA